MIQQQQQQTSQWVLTPVQFNLVSELFQMRLSLTTLRQETEETEV